MEECLICGKVVKTKLALAGHMRSHKAKVELDTAKELETPIIEQKQPTITLRAICDQLFTETKSGEVRSVLNAYKNLTTEKPLKEILESMREERMLKDAQVKAKIQNYINKL